MTTQLIHPDRIVKIRSHTREGVLSELLHALEETGVIERAADLLGPLLERERLMSTGIGYGIAIPHIKGPYVEDFVVVLGYAPEPVDFGAIDGRPVSVFVLIVGPEGRQSQYLRLLARISKALMSKRDRILGAKAPLEALADLLAE